ncbi:hypothetical protein RRG08_015314 [Elysia crispata]|uniref:MAM domain-containing protein n=1 Tax=Elysia crispata TaxID=231223 RepID=A0AAE1A681_9GAST|nr:hypothetical protein RRG08_015314 [Elysia crispata]
MDQRFMKAYPNVDRKCTTNRKGLPACNFNTNNCFVSDSKGSWTHVKEGKNGPVPPYEKGYVYLDGNNSQGEPIKMHSEISSGTRAICVDFYYASTGDASIPINIYIQKDSTRYARVRQIKANTGGEWQNDAFSCCLPNLKSSIKFAVEARSTEAGIAAIDYMDIRLSKMSCENNELVCYPPLPSQGPMDPPNNAPACPSNQEKLDNLSCDFTAENKTSPQNCGWNVAPGWDIRQKWDGTGQYDIIYSISTTEQNASLLSDIPNDLESMCLEIQFATIDTEENLDHVFSIRVVTQEESSLWGAAYEYKASNTSVWKKNSFDGPLPTTEDRKIQIISNLEGLKIDYIHIRTSNKSRATDVPRETLETWKTIFSCSSSSSVFLCGMKPDSSSKSKWSNGSVTDSVLRGNLDKLKFDL